MGADLSWAAGVVTYLWTGAMQQLSSKLSSELPAGAWLLTHTFGLRDRQPKVQLRADDAYRTIIERYDY